MNIYVYIYIYLCTYVYVYMTNINICVYVYIYTRVYDPSRRAPCAERFLACLASRDSDKFSLRGGKRHVVLVPTLARNSAAMHH